MPQGFFDDEDDYAEVEPSEDSSAPMSPSGVAANVFDGLWECQFCGQDCGSKQLELQVVGFCAVREASGSNNSPVELDTKPVWVPVEDQALEALIQMNALQFIEMSPEDRSYHLELLCGPPVTLSVASCTASQTDHAWLIQKLPEATGKVACDIQICGAWWPAAS
eukprot:scaffold544595_cov42-Prasinocladus_malaysianus.AAC.1